jgi:hypothetical protein
VSIKISKIDGKPVDLEGTNYSHFPSRLGFGTVSDCRLIWEGYDPYDK